jgi:hypothetical protein
MSSSRLLGRLILLAIVVLIFIAALHLIAWVLVPVLWIGLICATVVLVLRRGARLW